MTELKNLVSRLEGNSTRDIDSSKIDNVTRAELNRTMTEWSQRLQSLLENEKLGKQKPGDELNQSDKIKV